MTNHDYTRARGGSYIITEDLGEKVEAFRHLGLKTPDPDSQFFEDIQTELAHNLQASIGEENPVVRIKMRDLSDGVISLVDKVWGNDVFVVSTCPEIAHPSKGIAIELNRIISMHGETLGIGPRPGRPPLAHQVSALRSTVGDNPVVIAEDGIFTSSTLKRVVEALRRQKINVVGAAVGFSFVHITGNHELESEHLKVHEVQRHDSILDWVPDHDFLPFVPGCGKVLGVKMGGDVYPFYNEEHATFSMPYVRPFGPTSEWASLPQETENKFSGACLRLAIELFTELGRLNGKELAIRDIVHARQRVSIPVSVDTGDPDRVHSLPRTDTKIVNFLAESL